MPHRLEEFAGWLSPRGKFHDNEGFHHLERAEKICNRWGYQFTTPPGPGDALVDRGWMKLSPRGKTVDFWTDVTRCPTQSQLDFIWDLVVGIKLEYLYICGEGRTYQQILEMGQ